MRPDILEKRANTLKNNPEAVAAFARGPDPVKIILAEQGLLREMSNTIIYDQVANPEQRGAIQMEQK